MKQNVWIKTTFLKIFGKKIFTRESTTEYCAGVQNELQEILHFKIENKSKLKGKWWNNKNFRKNGMKCNFNSTFSDEIRSDQIELNQMN